MLKRTIDIVASVLALLILSPLLLLLYAIIRSNLGSPVLFRQVRPGLNAKPFEMVKFRTMTDEKDEFGALLPDSRRLTKLGRFLRRSSLDELPGIWNIIKGDMSLVGPRPLLVRYLPYYSEEESLRHSVRPGLTGLAQVAGRNSITWDQKLALDVEYVKNRTNLLDFQILVNTVRVVLSRKGVLEAAPEGPLDRHRAKMRGDKGGL